MSTLRVNTLQNTSGVEVYTAKAWVNFNGTGTVAIRASGNVSSITDNGTGDYTLNFTSAMADANYAVDLQTTGFSTTNPTMHAVIHGSTTGGATTKTTSQIRIQVAGSSSSNYFDAAEINAAIFR
jgi:hypothetical protein